MILKTTHAPGKKTIKTLELLAEMEQALKQTIRKSFDSAIFDYHARACIDIAKDMGFTEEAEEMENDLYIETN